ncbi:MAG: hypothetical protein AB8B86_17540 [Pseudomonadales bacterium]
MDTLANWMQSTWITNFLVENNAWIWSALETFHFFGMSLLFGSLLIMDLRLIGWEKASTVFDTGKLAPMALAGFGVNLITGIIFCFADPHRYLINISFQIKMLLILLAGLNFLYFKLKIESAANSAGPGEDTAGIAKISGAVSLLVWLGVLCFGRLIPYLGTG